MARSLLGLSFLLMLGCPETGKESADSVGVNGTTTGDEDGDGYKPSEGDCDDSNDQVNPGVAEICDGVDNNCDGVIDEGTMGTFYADADGDGFGDLDVGMEACEAPDGYVTNSDDCDDAQPLSYPGNAEVCDEIDNDCDGVIDNGVGDVYYADGDGDTYGDAGAPQQACSPPPGMVLDNTDCDDTTNKAYPGNAELCDEIDNNCDGVVDEGVENTYYADVDGDGYGDATLVLLACSLPAGYSADDTDCDDTRYETNPDAPELCNGYDDDCDGDVDEDSAADAGTWYADTDSDGYGDPATAVVSCSPPAGYVSDNTDCDDGRARSNPGAPELCNGFDDDCDGTVDESSALDASTWYYDADSDGYGNATVSTVSCSAPAGYVADDTDCNDGTAAAHPGATEICDSLDNDCDGTIDEPDATDASVWYADADFDLYGDPTVSQTACDQPVGYVSDNTDCDDGRSRSNPAATEFCNGYDDDCDGTVDEDDAIGVSTWYADSDGDTYGNPAVSDVACDQPAGYVADDTDCDDTVSTTNPGGTEVCNAVDDDCNGVVDDAYATDASTWYADTDADGYGNPALTQISCNKPVGYVADNTDCNDSTAAANPGEAEVCDGIDNDCDGSVDEADATDASTWYADSDGDTYGDSATSQRACTQPFGYVADNTDCDDAMAAVYPGATEHCNGYDDNCDGFIDEDTAVDAGTWYADADGDSYGNPAVSDVACDQPSGYVANDDDCDDSTATTNPAGTEVCNGIDDDCDGTVDDSATDALTWYADADGDAYGNASSTSKSCTQPAGYVADNTDCNDTTSAAHPGATEVCDGIDNDCDGSIDEDGGVSDGDTYYADDDSDGYGDESSTIVACSLPSGYADNYYDCDDTDPTEPVTVDDGGTAGGAGTAADPLDTIQAGIDLADSCVVVLEGSYVEHDIDLGGKSLDVWGVDGREVTTIDPGLSVCSYTNPTACHPVWLVNSGTGAAPTIHGFWVTGGTGYLTATTTSETCADSDPSHAALDTCTVTTDDFCGGGAYISGDDPQFSDMVFDSADLPEFAQEPTGAWSQSWVSSAGGGVCALDSAATFDDVVFASNYADEGGGLYVGLSSTVELVHSWFDDNSASDGAGIATDASDLTVTNSVIACNTATVDGGAVFSETSGTVTFTNIVIALNTAGTSATNGSQTYTGSSVSIKLWNMVAQASTASPMFYNIGTGSIGYSDSYNAGGGGITQGSWTATSTSGTGGQYTTITCDGDWTNDDASLVAGAAAINAGDPSILDGDGSRSDEGAYGGPEGTW